MNKAGMLGCLVVAALGCAEGGADYGDPVPEILARQPSSALSGYRVPAESLPDGCQPTPLEILGLPESVDMNPFVSTDAGLRREVALLLGLEEELVHSVDAALLSAYQPSAELGVYGLELATEWSAEETRGRLAARFADTAGDKATIWRTGKLVFVVVDQGANQLCIDAVLDHIRAQ